ncbi:Ubiquitin--protein ligase [Bertholletia excelsa]
MSTRGARGSPLRGYVRNSRRRKIALEVDLNVPPSDNRDQEGTSSQPSSQNVQVGHQGGDLPSAPIDVDAFDDDVVISSPRTFAEAKNNSRRNHRSTVIVDVDSEERLSRNAPNGRNKRRRIPSNQTIINCDLYVNLERVELPLPQPSQQLPLPPPPKEPTFSCPVCMGPLVEEMSTKCGHIFCKQCIMTAIAVQSKCPTCRKKISKRDIIRVYLPSTN